MWLRFEDFACQNEGIWTHGGHVSVVPLDPTANECGSTIRQHITQMFFLADLTSIEK